MFNVLLRYFKTFKTEVDPGMLIRLILVGFLIILIVSSVIIKIEPEHFSNFGDAFWWSIVTATTVGYGDFFPTSLWGRTAGVILMFLGIGLFGAITATVTDLFIKLQNRRELGQLEAEYNNHILICGWNKKAKEIITQIINESIKNRQMVLVTNNIDRDPLPNNDLTHFIKGSIGDKEALLRAGVKRARTAIILNEDEDDATTVLGVLNVKELNPDIYTVAEISNPQNKTHMENASVNEVIVHNDINSRIMVRTALYNGVSNVISELLDNDYGNEIYIKEVEEDDLGEAYVDLLTKYKVQRDITLLGIKRDEKTLLNLHNTEKIKKDDQLIYVAKS